VSVLRSRRFTRPWTSRRFPRDAVHVSIAVAVLGPRGMEGLGSENLGALQQLIDRLLTDVEE
jgi:hypothetical protein